MKVTTPTPQGTTPSPAAKEARPRSSAATGQPASLAATHDRVSLSPQVMALSAGLDAVDINVHSPAYLASLRDAIEAGTLLVDARALAEAILSDAGWPVGPTSQGSQ